MRPRDLVPGPALVVVALALAGHAWTPRDPVAQDWRDLARALPSAEHWAGVDALGRDLFSRAWLGAANTTTFALAATLLALAGATALLAVDRLAPRPVSALLRGLVNLSVAVPILLVSLLLLVALGPAPSTLVVAAAVGMVPFAFRQLRAAWAEQRGALHVVASEVIGGGALHRFRFAIWPNLRGDVAALARLLFAGAVLELSGLAFLGLIGDPDFAELGAILRQGQPELFTAPHLVVVPALALALLLGSVHHGGTAER